MHIACIIPARYGSTRLPGKPLAMIGDKPMIQRVYEQVSKAMEIEQVIVATDDQRVYDAVVAFGGQAMMTRPDHLTGTDRLAEVAATHTEIDVVINVQGDEPLIDASVIDALAREFKEDSSLQMGTVGCPLLEEEYNEPSAVKVIVNRLGNAMYFSRSLIPYPRNAFVQPPLKHVGMYGESLEQLRALENGYTIRVITTDQRFVGVDTPEDLDRVNEIFRTLDA